MAPERQWLGLKDGNAKGRLAFAPTKKMKEEYENVGEVREILDLLDKAGNLQNFTVLEVEEQLEWVKREVKRRGITLKSNDMHMVGLVSLSGCKMIVSTDKNLGKDFHEVTKIHGKKGQIYKRAKDHADNINEYKCS